MTTTEVFEYMLVIGLPVEVRSRVEEQRAELIGSFRIIQPQTGKPNISLARFCAVKRTEHKIIRRLEWVAAETKTFTVQLDGFGGYPMHAMFIRIRNQQLVLDLVRSIKKARMLMKAAGEDPYFLLDPQVALAGRMDKQAYTAAMKIYEHKKFSADFPADAFLLLKKKKEENKYQVVKRFEFESSPAMVKQQLLFS